MPALRTSLVAFDTAVADLSHLLDDPVDVLFGVQLGGGTDIGNALGACQRLITRPPTPCWCSSATSSRAVTPALLRPASPRLVRSGVTVLVLLALSDEGAPASDQHHEAEARRPSAPSSRRARRPSSPTLPIGERGSVLPQTSGSSGCRP